MQDTKVPQNKVIIIGGDHHNGLGLARIFGSNGKRVTAIVISKKKYSWIATSKYIENHKIFKSEKEAFDHILSTYVNNPLKPLLIPYSDAAALELDCRLNEFKEKFIVPSINNEQGRIAAMMDKDAQYKWAVEHNIKMAQSLVFNVNDDIKLVAKTINFPIILKPIVSAQGSKFDINICNSEAELKQSINLLRQKNYEKILVQKYLSNRSELLIVGAIANNYVFSVHRVIRRWPDPGGCGSFSKLIHDKDIIEKCSLIIKSVAEFGYKGLIDIETFFVDGNIYLNEINWRNSGGGFRAINDGFFYAFWWYKWVLTKSLLSEWKPCENSWSMVEYADVRHIFKLNLSPIRWFCNLIRCDNFALWNKNDLKPFFSKFIFAMFR